MHIITATLIMKFEGTRLEAEAWASDHTVFDMLDYKGTEVNGPCTTFDTQPPSLTQIHTGMSAVLPQRVDR